MVPNSLDVGLRMCYVSLVCLCNDARKRRFAMRIARKILATLLVVGVYVGLAPVAYADVSDNPNDEFVLDPNNPDRYIQKGVDLDNVVVSDGNQHVTGTKSFDSCIAPLGIEVVCKSTTAYIVMKGGKMEQYYSWWAAPLVQSSGAVRALGFRNNNKRIWRGAGIGRQGHASVPWYGPNKSEIMAMKAVKVKSVNPPLGIQILWN